MTEYNVKDLERKIEELESRLGSALGAMNSLGVRTRLIEIDLANIDDGIVNSREPVPMERLGDFEGCFEIEMSKSSESSYLISFRNPYFCIAGKTYEASDQEISCSSGIVSLKIDVSSSVPSSTIELYADLSALQTAQENKNYYIIPLYTIENGDVTCDWRKGANAAMWEF